MIDEVLWAVKGRASLKHLQFIDWEECFYQRTAAVLLNDENLCDLYKALVMRFAIRCRLYRDIRKMRDCGSFPCPFPARGGANILSCQAVRPCGETDEDDFEFDS